MSQESTTQFQSWAVIELMGHSKIAGHVSELQLGGNSMLRVDVPETKEVPAFTRIFNPSAVYAINPCKEDFARKSAEQIQAVPIMEFDMQALIRKMVDAKVERKLALVESTEEVETEDEKEEKFIF